MSIVFTIVMLGVAAAAGAYVGNKVASTVKADVAALKARVDAVENSIKSKVAAIEAKL